MRGKARKILYEIGETIELVMAVVVILADLVAVCSLVPEFGHYWQNRMDEEAFSEFLGAVFGVVIGIEFLKMLCKPSSENIIEVLIFLVSRHMIVEKTTVMENLLSIVSIGILFFFRRFMVATRPHGEHPAMELFGGSQNEAEKERQENEKTDGEA